MFFYCSFSFRLHARSRQTLPHGPRRFPPFRIAGNLYYVGSEDLAAYLIVDAAGQTSSSTAISNPRRR